MPKFYPSLPDDLRDWALSQQIFFIASSPRFGSHVNISPKGLPAATFTILNPNRACYIDATGSGAETISHLYETGRATVMFCSFDKVPRIMRFFCRGRVVEFDRPEYRVLLREMGKEEPVGARAVIVLDIFKVQTSCGYGVPFLSTHTPPSLDSTTTNILPQPRLSDRETLGHWASKTVSAGKITAYQAQNNAYSLDNLPALKSARRTNGEILWLGDLRAYVMRVGRQWDVLVLGMLVAVLGVVVLRVLGLGLGSGSGFALGDRGWVI